MVVNKIFVGLLIVAMSGGVRAQEPTVAESACKGQASLRDAVGFSAFPGAGSAGLLSNAPPGRKLDIFAPTRFRETDPHTDPAKPSSEVNEATAQTQQNPSMPGMQMGAPMAMGLQLP